MVQYDIRFEVKKNTMIFVSDLILKVVHDDIRFDVKKYLTMSVSDLI